MKEHKDKMIFSMRLAGYLMYHGFPCLRMERDKTAVWAKKIYYFQNSPQIEDAIAAYIAM